MTREYHILTERLGFSIWQPEDIALALSLWGNPDVAKYVSADGIFSEKDIRKRLNLEMQNQQNHNIQYYPLFVLEDDSFIGCCGLKPYSPDCSVLELGFYLKPEYWGKGYISEAAKKVMEYVFSTMKIENIYAGHHPDNLASKKALTRLGFKYFKDEYYAPTGLFHPLYKLS